MTHLSPIRILQELENLSDEENDEHLEEDENYVEAANLIDEHFNAINNAQENDENRSIRANLNKTLVNDRKESTSRHENKRKREEGVEYSARKKTPQGYITVDKEKRQMGEACTSVRCNQYKNLRCCNQFTEGIRNEIFRDYWQLSWDQRKIFIQSMVDRITPKNKTTYNVAPNRELTMKYYLKLNNVRTQVCKLTFMNTLGIKASTLRSWLLDNTPPKPRETRRPPARNVDMTRRKSHLTQFFHNIAKVPSHYCRRDTTRLYMERPVTSKSEAYRIYCEDAALRNTEPMSWTTFLKEMKMQRISVFKPRKDQCNVCTAWREGNLEEDAYKQHLELKQLANDKKRADSRDKDPNTSVLCMDVQATLLCPVLFCNAVYFKKKLCVHNYTFYDFKTANVSCYVWHEGEGGLESGNFASMLVDKLTADLKAKPTLKKIILYSDGCGYQNRCVVISNALLLFAVENNVTVEHNYLEKGHTQMPVDSVHATTEIRLEKKIIGDPTDYVEHISSARISKDPYDVKYVKHDLFKDYSKVKFVDKIRPGNKAGDPTVTDIRCMLYLPTKEIQYKLNYKDEWQKLPQKINSNASTILKPTYNQSLPIKADKYQNLQELLQYIPQKSVPFYGTLMSQ